MCVCVCVLALDLTGKGGVKEGNWLSRAIVNDYSIFVHINHHLRFYYRFMFNSLKRKVKIESGKFFDTICSHNYILGVSFSCTYISLSSK